MATLLEDLTDIEEKAQGLVENKVANFAYTQEAYNTDDVAGVSEYNVENNQNIPVADAETLDVNPTVLNKGYRSQASSITRMLMNHFLGRISYNLNKSIDIFKKGFLGIKNALGKPNGIATLNEEGYLSNEQIQPVLTKEKLKEFLFSGKEVQSKDITDGETEVQQIFSARSINTKEDVIIYKEYNIKYSLVVCKYDGDVITEIARLTFDNLGINFVCSYKHYDLFHITLSTDDGYVENFIQFNYNTMELSHFEMNTGETLYEISFNSCRGKWKLINSLIKVNNSSSSTATIQEVLKTIELDTFEVTETTLAIPSIRLSDFDIGSTSETKISLNAYLSDDILLLVSRTTYSQRKLMFVLDINLLTEGGIGFLTQNNLIKQDSLPVYAVSSAIRANTKIAFRGSTDSSYENATILILDKGNIYLTKIGMLGDKTLTNLGFEGDYFCECEQTNSVRLWRVFKNSKPCTMFSNFDYTLYHVYDSVILTKTISTLHNDYHLRDVEDSARVIPRPDGLDMFPIIKSNRRAYTIYEDILKEITNVLD